MFKKSFAAMGIVVGAALLVGGLTPASASGDVLTPEGFHKVKLGQSEAKALRSGYLSGDGWDDGSCNRYATVDRPGDNMRVAISHENGVVRVRVPDNVRTYEGIGVGSTVAEVKETYEDVTEYRLGLSAPVPGYGDRSYEIWIEDSYNEDGTYRDDAKVIQLGLTANEKFDCALLGG
ncbi:hypothetical protein AB5J62_35390 [Amycolatopsis sp. cg5]|uniref:hypothetical protein n=1 Tax=Amycolatopsis sp. cg5 TaxID=3238802 RepID=UPI003525D79C